MCGCWWHRGKLAQSYVSHGLLPEAKGLHARRRLEGKICNLGGRNLFTKSLQQHAVV